MEGGNEGKRFIRNPPKIFLAGAGRGSTSLNSEVLSFSPFFAAASGPPAFPTTIYMRLCV